MSDHFRTLCIKDLILKKAFQDDNIPLKPIKVNEDIFLRTVFKNFHQSLFNGEFPDCLKQDEDIPVFKKKEKGKTW